MGHTAAVEDLGTPVAAPSRTLAPERSESPSAINYPESWAYRVKNKILGPPMVSEQLTQERLANPVAIGVLAPDMISSSAYGTEEMLRIMVPIIGIGAFSMVIPITVAILLVMFFVMFSYLQVIGVYTRIGGSYVVARDNFGPKVAQVAAVALLIDYTVTVAVQTSAGTAALTSAVKDLVPYTVPITVGVTLLMLFANLRGIREAGSFFAIPTYFYIGSLAVRDRHRARRGGRRRTADARDPSAQPRVPGRTSDPGMAHGSRDLLLPQGVRQRRRLAHRDSRRSPTASRASVRPWRATDARRS